MELRDVKRRMHRTVYFHGAPYTLTGVIYRGRKASGEEYYQAELQDARNKNSVVICGLGQIEQEEKLS